MLVEKTYRDVSTSDAISRTRVELKASADAVRRFILPYTKLAYAAVRETIQNAADECTDFSLQVPSLLDPRFVIRDTGKGIPGPYLATHYALAGHSTKTDRNTNDKGDALMGHGGIGRFAPLAITDQFFVRSWHGGTMTMVSVYFDHEGYPVVDVLDSSPSDEPSGLEISFAVDVGKLKEFREAVASTLCFFPSHYNITWIGEPIETELPSSKFSGSGWWLTPGKHTVVMGRVAYSYDAYFEDDGLVRTGLTFTVPMGSITVNDAREAVVMNERTKAALRTRLAEVKKEFIATASASLDSCSTLWEATVAIQALGDWQIQRLFSSAPLAYKGKPVSSTVRFQSTQYTIGTVSGWDISRRKRPKINYRSNANINPSETVVYVNDLKNKVAETLKHYHNTSGASVAEHYIIVPPDNHAAVLQELGDPPYVLMSTLPPLPKVPRVSSTAVSRPVRMKVCDPGGYFRDADVDLLQPAVYFTTNAGTAEPALSASRYILLTILKNVRKTELPVVEVPKSLWHHLKRTKGWIKLEDAIAADLPDWKRVNKDSLDFAFTRNNQPYSNREYSLWHSSVLWTFLFPGLDLSFCFSSEMYSVLGAKDNPKFKAALTKLLAKKPLVEYLVSGNCPDKELLDFLKA